MIDGQIINRTNVYEGECTGENKALLRTSARQRTALLLPIVRVVHQIVSAKRPPSPPSINRFFRDEARHLSQIAPEHMLCAKRVEKHY